MKITRQGDRYRLESRLWLPRPVEQIWPFFADATNLDRLTPAFLSFEIRTPPPIVMRAGTIIDYRLRVHRLPLRWRTEIVEWDPPHAFADHQIRGPYDLWYHRHLFLEAVGGTECVDLVDYRLPCGPLGRLLHALVVRRDIERIFGERRAALLREFGESAGRPVRLATAAG